MGKSVISIEDMNIHLIKKSNVKRISIRILPPKGEVKVIAPKRYSNIMIKRILLLKSEHIKSHIFKIREQFKILDAAEDCDVREGSNYPLWGENYSLTIRRGNKNKVYIEENRLVLQIKSGFEDSQKMRLLLDKFYREQMMKVLPQMVEKYSFVVGEVPNEYRIKKMRTRWGTCNINARRIWLSLELAKKPMYCLEYVVVHELVHLLERYHNKRFYSFLDKFYPNWKEATQELKKGIKIK